MGHQASRARPVTLDLLAKLESEVRRVIAAVEDLKDIEENWELLDVKEKSVKREKVANAVSKDPSDPKANR